MTDNVIYCMVSPVETTKMVFNNIVYNITEDPMGYVLTFAQNNDINNIHLFGNRIYAEGLRDMMVGENNLTYSINNLKIEVN